MTHGSLFSGIGGFDLAAHWAGIENIFACEIDEFCRKVLNKRFPNTTLYQDIKETNFEQYSGTVDIISGGFPCQPFSIAGKRAGTKDNRYLWGEMLRVVREIKPRWVIAENVRGITNLTDGSTFETVCNDLEINGYEVQPFIIPALAVGAPHKRDRVWFIANRNSPRESQSEGINKNKRGRTFNESKEYISSTTANTSGTGSQRSNKRQISLNNNTGYSGGESWSEKWIEALTRIYGMDHGLPGGMDGLNQRYKHKSRRERIKTMGNSIVPQIAYQIFLSILDVEVKR